MSGHPFTSAGPEWPSGFTSSWLSLSGGRMALVQGGQGSPVVLVHGLAGQSLDFREVAPYLAPHHRLIIPDLIGFGRSDKPPAGYSLDWHLELLAEMARELALPACPWMGHSMGGMLVLLMAVSHPERVTRVAAVGPSGGHVRPRLALRLRLKILFDSSGRLRCSHSAWISWVVYLWVAHIFKDWRHPQVKVVARRSIPQWQGPQAEALQVSTWRSAWGILNQPIWPLMPYLTRPALLVSGLRDPVVPHREIERLWLNMAPGPHDWLRLSTGHMIPHAHPSFLARRFMAFLQERTDPA